LHDVSLQINDFIERVTPPEALQQAAQRYAADTLRSLELPEQRAAAVARQVARGHLPALLQGTRQLASVASASVRAMVKQYLSRAADSAIGLRGGEAVGASGLTSAQPLDAANATATALCGTPVSVRQLNNADDPAWYRPPRRGKPTPIVFPKMSSVPVSGNLVLRHLAQPDAPLEHVSLRLLLRDSTPDVALGKVAVHQLLSGVEGHRTLANRLWDDYAVRLTWSAWAGSIVLVMEGTQQGIGLALRQVRRALAFVAKPPTQTVENAKQAAAAEQGVGEARSLLDQAQSRLGTLFSYRSEQSMNLDLQSRIRAITPKQLAAFWSAVNARGEFALSWAGRTSLADAQRAALSLMPPSLPRRPAAPRPTTGLRPRIWVFDDDRANVDLQVLWPSRGKHPPQSREGQLLAGIAWAAKELGNLNAARPHNPTTQFTLEHQSLADADVYSVFLQGVGVERLATVLRELDGYFSRLVERVDFAQLSRLGVHDLQRRQLAWFATPASAMALLDNWTLSGESNWYLIDEFDSVGSIRRERMLAAARALSLAQATIIARGPALSIESTLRAANSGECTVVPQ
jgi:hypothetical protein